MIQAHERDIHKLLDSFVQAVVTDGKELSYSTFKRIWAERNFSFIHYAVPNQPQGCTTFHRQSNKQYLQLLFTAALLRLSYPSPCNSVIVLNHPSRKAAAASPDTPADASQQHGALQPLASGSGGALPGHQGPAEQQASSVQPGEASVLHPPTSDHLQHTSAAASNLAKTAGSDAAHAQNADGPRAEGDVRECAVDAPAVCNGALEASAAAQPARGLPPSSALNTGTVVGNRSDVDSDAACASARHGVATAGDLAATRGEGGCCSATAGLPAGDTAAREAADAANVAVPRPDPALNGPHECDAPGESDPASSAGGGLPPRSAVDDAGPTDAGEASAQAAASHQGAAIPLSLINLSLINHPVHAHPFLQQVRRDKAALSARRRSNAPLQGRSGDASLASGVMHLNQSVPLEAQIAAVFCIYTLYCTQPTTPKIRIYLSAARLSVLHKVLEAMKQAGVHDGARMLQRLAADDAFVFGTIAVRRKDQSEELDSAGVGQTHERFAAQQRAQRRATHASVLEDAMRRAMMHIWQAGAQTGELADALRSYGAAVGALFEGAPDGGALSALSLLKPQLPAQLETYSTAVLQDIRLALAPTPADAADLRAKRHAAKQAMLKTAEAPEATPADEDDDDLEAELRSAGGLDEGEDLQAPGAVDDLTEAAELPWMAGLRNNGTGSLALALKLEERRQYARRELERCWLPHVKRCKLN